MGRAERRRDRFTSAYALAALPVFLLFVFGHELDRALNLSLLLVPLLLLPALCLIMLLVGASIWSLWTRRWRHVLSVFLGPPMAAALLYGLYQSGVTPQRLRLEYSRSDYERRIAEAPRVDGEPRFMTFDWGETGGAAVTNVFLTLVYDESGEVLLDAGKRSAAWVARANRDERMRMILSRDWHTNVTHLDGPFAVATESYP